MVYLGWTSDRWHWTPPGDLAAGAMIVCVSAIVAFISGMAVRRRIALNLVITAIAVIVTYAIGLLAKPLWGIAV